MKKISEYKINENRTIVKIRLPRCKELLFYLLAQDFC